ncbi:hypothetical protein A2310_02265 [candidate division WOR-1 bacterium RIFOXYB2_FULL_37_13]|uniref:Type II secretion system protein GspF domain-containing protein n=1 Tax=candidate division WOR-1 bacterium RIFOXYB2_FULL_37_13 TaxID=1802579 RepID=A0A1F4SMF1_UNCSA|nr:MAG: hypothetical protein A2310_02265 [candidate division WOR-1 bacterium RIFOXYB2_FULL_37_13]
MSKFKFKARKETGELIEGEIESSSFETLKYDFSAKGYTPVFIEKKFEGISIPKLWVFKERAEAKEVSIFFRQLSSMFSAGVPLFESLTLVQEQIGSPFLKKIVKDLSREIEFGSTFSQALSKHPFVFSRLVVVMVEAAENGGILGEVLKRISWQMEKDIKLQLKIKGALRYPVMVVIALIIAFVFAVTFIIPKFTAVFRAAGGALPLPTRILIWLNFFVINYWGAVLTGGIILFVGGRMYCNTPFGMKKIDTLKLKLPILGSLVLKLSLSRFFRMLSSMISSGIPLTRGLEVASEVSNNVFLSENIISIKNIITSGSSFSDAMKNFPIFPSVSVHMISVGEQSGDLENMLTKNADYFDEETDYMIDNLMTLLEPVLIFILAIFVTVLALGIFLPTWNLMNLYMGR